MSVVELSDEDTVAILSETFVESLAEIRDKTRQIAVLKRLHGLLDSSAPQHYIYESLEGFDELQVIRVGGDQRIYSRLIVGLPHEDQHYNVLFVFDVGQHQYRPDQLATFDSAAKQRLDEITAVETIDALEDYLDEMDAFSAEDIKERIDRLEG